MVEWMRGPSEQDKQPNVMENVVNTQDPVD